MYCNYSKDKFGNELTFIIPSWINMEECSIHPTTSLRFKSDGEMMFINSILNFELHYLQLIENKYTPQQARQVLPNALKTEINMCGFISDWKHFFELRDNSAAHPDMVRLVKPLHEEFIRLGYLKNE